MLKGLRRLYSGDFNSRRDTENSDGTRTITLTKRGDSKVYKFTVKDLYGKNEEVLSHEVIDQQEIAKQKPWIAERMKQAKEEKEKEDKEKKNG